MKRTLSLLLAVLMLLSVPVTASAGTMQAELKEDAVLLKIDGKMANDVEPIIVSGRTMVPFRKLYTKLGAENIGWDGSTREVTASIEGRVIKLKIGNKKIWVDGKEAEIDVAPIIQNSVTYIPLRFVAETLGYEVIWYDSLRLVVLNKPEQEVDVTELYPQLTKDIQHYVEEDFREEPTLALPRSLELAYGRFYSTEKHRYPEVGLVTYLCLVIDAYDAVLLEKYHEFLSTGQEVPDAYTAFLMDLPNFDRGNIELDSVIAQLDARYSTETEPENYTICKETGTRIDLFDTTESIYEKLGNPTVKIERGDQLVLIYSDGKDDVTQICIANGIVDRISSSSRKWLLDGKVAIGDHKSSIPHTDFIGDTEYVWTRLDKDVLCTFEIERKSARFAYNNFTDRDMGIMAFHYTNAFRYSQGVEPVEWSEAVYTAAKNHVDDMFAREYYSHNSPTETFAERMDRELPWADSVGENIVLYGILKPTDLIAGWRDSPDHRDNMLNPNFKFVGISHRKEGAWILATQIFTSN